MELFRKPLDSTQQAVACQPKVVEGSNANEATLRLSSTPQLEFLLVPNSGELRIARGIAVSTFAWSLKTSNGIEGGRQDTLIRVVRTRIMPISRIISHRHPEVCTGRCVWGKRGA